jgi:DNA-binding transcriptional MerR regulator
MAIVEKAPDAFRTISEVADEIDVPQHVLRFWESRFSQIRPMNRGGGRRYYRPDDVDLLRGIRHLLYGEGYTIRGVQRILREQGGAFVQNVWRAGAEPAPPLREEDAEDAGSASGDGHPEQSLFSFSERGDDDTATGRVDQAAGEAARLVSAENRRKLEVALGELLSCRQIIERALGQN